MLTEEVEIYLKSLNRKKVVIYGIEGHICLLQTVIDLLERKEYQVFFVNDAVSSNSSLDRKVAI